MHGPCGMHFPQLARSDQTRPQAGDLMPFIQQAQAADATSLQAIADAIKARGIPTPGGRGGWYPATVARAERVNDFDTPGQGNPVKEYVTNL